MADSRSWAIILALQAQLQTITTANGYITNLGQSVWVNDGQRPSADAFGLMLYSESIIGPGLERERPGKPTRDFGVLIEAGLTTAMDDAQQQIHNAIEDVERCIAGFGPSSPLFPAGATSVHVADVAVLDRPDGEAVVAMQVRIIVRYFR